MKRVAIALLLAACQKGKGASAPEPGLKVTRASLPEETHVVLLEPKTA